MKCSKCGVENDAAHKFCANCGTSLTVLANVEFAGFGRRGLAYLLDSLAVVFTAFTITFVMVFVYLLVTSGKAVADLENNLFIGIFPWILITIFTYFYWIYFTGKWGQTLGKKVLKIKVVRLDGTEKVGYLKAFIRLIGFGISMWAFGIGFLWMLWDKKKQTWADKIAETVVIKI